MSRYAELVRKCPLRPIKNDKQNARAIKVINGLLDQGKMTKDEADYLEVLGLLVRDYEEAAYATGNLSPQEMLRGLIENHNLTQAQLARESGVPDSMISNILRHNRVMGVKTIDRLARYFKVSPAVFHNSEEQ